ncbi:MAG: hypothetical protein D3910_00420, partial [Candidatus Electrothrix sp. ATG2]|nr:hypothetical protein [Candidatus Electrothrix sp. ATG2]
LIDLLNVFLRQQVIKYFFMCQRAECGDHLKNSTFERTTTLWAAKMDKIGEKAVRRAVRGPVLCNWCKSDPLIPSKMVYCGLSRSFFTASHAVVLKK